MKKIIFILVIAIGFFGHSCVEPSNKDRPQETEKVTNNIPATPEPEKQVNNDKGENQPQVDKAFLTVDILMYAVIGALILVVLMFLFLFSQIKQLNNRIRKTKREVMEDINSAQFRLQGEGNKVLNDTLSKRISELEYQMRRLTQEQMIAQAQPMPMQQVVQPTYNVISPAPKVSKVLYSETANEIGVFDKVSESYNDTYSLFKIEYEQDTSFGSISFLDSYPTAVRLGIAHKEGMLKPICEITEENLDPKTITTTQVGKVEKNDAGLWRVVGKIKLTIK